MTNLNFLLELFSKKKARWLSPRQWSLSLHRSHPEAVVAFRVFELESEVGGWIADSAEGCWARVSKPHNYRDHDVVRLGAEMHIFGKHPVD